MRTIIGLSLCLLLLMASAACNEGGATPTAIAATTATPTPAPTPTRPPTPTAALAETATPTPAPTPTRPPTPTVALAKTATPTPAPTPTRPPTPTAALAETATPTPAPTPTRPPTPTVALAKTATPTPTVALAKTATPDPLAHFAPPDPVEGVGEVREALVAGRIFRLEVARTPSERASGLMERANLPQEDAMLFVFEAEEYRAFWMKNTLIPLDILFLDARGVVVDVQTMYPQIGAADDALKVYRSARPARYALEMNAGLAESLGLAPGTQVLFG